MPDWRSGDKKSAAARESVGRGRLGLLELRGRFRMLADVVLEGGLQGLLGQDRAVDLDRGQAAEGVHDLLVGEVHRLVDAAALDQLGGHAGARDGRTAPEGLEPGILDLPVLDLQADLHDVAARRGAHLAHAIGILQVTHVAGVHEVVHHGGIIQGVGFAHGSTLTLRV
jgi:hypothetical protein